MFQKLTFFSREKEISGKDWKGEEVLREKWNFSLKFPEFAICVTTENDLFFIVRSVLLSSLGKENAELV